MNTTVNLNINMVTGPGVTNFKVTVGVDVKVGKYAFKAKGA